MIRFLALTMFVAGLVPKVALADKVEAQAHLLRAQDEVAQGRYETAIHEFELAYAAYPSAQFLFNIAQIQRKNLRDCPSALASYQRFLSAGPFAGAALQSAAKVARKHQALLQERCPTQELEEASELLDAPGYPETQTTVAPEPLPPYDYGFKPLPSVVRIDGGGSQYVLGNVDVPFTGSIRASYAFGYGPDVLHARILTSVGITPMRYRGIESGVAYFLPILAGLEVASDSEGVIVIGALQAGLLGIAGLSDGNPMTVDGKAASTLWSGILKARVGIEIPLGPRWSLSVGAEAGLASAPDGLATDIDSISSLGGTAGVSRVL